MYIKAVEKSAVSVTRNIFWVLFSNIFGKFFSLISGIIIARILFPKDFGIISMAATFSGLIAVFSRLGLEAFILSRPEISKVGINSVNILNMIVGMAICIIMIIGGPVAASFYKTPEIKYILIFSGLSFFISSLSAIPRALLVKEMKQNVISKISVLLSIMSSTLTIIFALNGFHYLSFVYPTFITAIITTIVFIYITNWKFSFAFDKETIRHTFKYSKSFLSQFVLSYFVYNADYIFIGSLLGPILLGYYFFGYEKALIVSITAHSVVCSVFFPLLSKHQTDNIELKKVFFSLLKKQVFILYPITFLLIVLAPEIIQTVFGSKWNNSILTFQLILGYTFFQTLALSNHVLFDATGKPKQNLKHFLLITPICMIAIFLGVKIDGLRGVSIAAFISHSLASILLFMRTCKVYNWKLEEFLLIPIRNFIPILLQLPFIILIKIYLNNIMAPQCIFIILIVPISLVLYLLTSKILLKETFDSTFLAVKKEIIKIFSDNTALKDISS